MKWSKERIRFVVLRTIGNFFVLFALWGMAMTFGPALYFEVRYQWEQSRNVRYVVEESKPVSFGVLPTSTPIPLSQSTFFGQLTGGNTVQAISPVSAQFGIVIPKINANAPIYPNVNAADSAEYLSVLQKGVAHAAGTVFPGIPGNIFLFAHSTDSFWNVGRYNAIFYLLSKLENGDEVNVFFNGIRHVYRVVNKIIVDPKEVEYLTQSPQYEQLTLQTCWPPGTTLKRMIILARPEREFRK